MLQPRLSPHFKAVLQALLVTILWSTSWILIKIGLKDIPALTFAGIRYCLAFLCLLSFFFFSHKRGQSYHLNTRDWFHLAVLGFLFYAITQGAQFLGLYYLPSVTVSILFNFTALFVALLGMILLNEKLSVSQWGGMALFLAGVLVYFYPIGLLRQEWWGLVIVLAGVLANAMSSIFGRFINRPGNLPPLLVTVVSMGMGAVPLLAAGAWIQGIPNLTPSNWLLIGWLAVINTAFAFTLWNRALQVLTAFESTIINGTMLVLIAIQAWLFLGERMSLGEIGGLALVLVGALLVQLRSNRSPD